MHNKKLIIFFFLIFSWAITSQAAIQKDNLTPSRNKFIYPYYAGVTFGYGATTWGYLIPPDENAAITLSTPVKVNENGVMWGFFMGYEFLPTFALEAAYEHYPRARVFFDERSLFTFEHNGLDSFSTDTESLSLVGRFMLIIPKNPNFRAFSSVGAAGVHREDMITDKWQLSPKFGVGIDYAITEHMVAEIGVDYTAGNGVSELNPSNSFIPFLYSAYIRYALRI